MLFTFTRHSLHHNTSLSYIPTVLQTQVKIRYILTVLIRVFDDHECAPARMNEFPCLLLRDMTVRRPWMVDS